MALARAPARTPGPRHPAPWHRPPAIALSSARLLNCNTTNLLHFYVRPVSIYVVHKTATAGSTMATAATTSPLSAVKKDELALGPPIKPSRQDSEPVFMSGAALTKPIEMTKGLSMNSLFTKSGKSAATAHRLAGDLALCRRAERQLVTNALRESPWEGLKLVSNISTIQAMTGQTTESSLHRAAWDGDFMHLKRLLDLGGDPALTDDDGNTPMHYAAWNGKVEAVMFLSEHGGDVNARNRRRETPLMHSVRSNHTNTFEALLALGARVNDGDSRGWTALHHAVLRHSGDMITLLVAKGASLTLTDKAGRCPRDLVYASDHSLNVGDFKRRKAIDVIFDELEEAGCRSKEDEKAS